MEDGLKVQGKVMMEKVIGNRFQHLHSNQKIVIYEMLKRGIKIDIIDENLELVRAQFANHTELLYDRDSSITPYHVSVLAGDKGITKRILSMNNISVPIGEVFLASNYDYILKAFEKFNGPVVIKPVHGSHGFDVYVNLNSLEEIANAIIQIIEHHGIQTEILIEEYYPAKEYRVFVTRNRDYAVLQRDPAHIFGDGIHTIEQLIEIENYRRMHPRTNALCEILVNTEMNHFLKQQDITLKDIPPKGSKVYLRPNSNVAMGGICIDYTDKVHPSVIDIGMKVLECFPGLPYVGIDYMTNNIEELQNSETYRIIEVNTVPGVHMHLRPAIGKPQNIAKYIVDMIFPETKEEENVKLIKRI